MTGADVAFVVRSQMKIFATADAYTTDYYAHRYTARQKDESRALVTPAWVEQKEMIKRREEHVKRDQRSVTEKWEQGHKVLGHVEKTDASRPRALLGIGDVTTSGKPFSSPLWKARQAIDNAVVALLDFEEARHLAAARSGEPLVVARAFADAQIHLTAASRALTYADPHPADLAGGTDRLSGLDTDTRMAGPTLDALLALPKGVKLLARFSKTLPYTAASSNLLGETLQALDARGNTFAALDNALVDILLIDVLPKTPLLVLLDAASTYVEAAGTNTTQVNDSPVTRLADGLLAHGDLAFKVSQDAAAKDGWSIAREDLLSIGVSSSSSSSGE